MPIRPEHVPASVVGKGWNAAIKKADRMGLTIGGGELGLLIQEAIAAAWDEIREHQNQGKKNDAS